MIKSVLGALLAFAITHAQAETSDSWRNGLLSAGSEPAHRVHLQGEGHGKSESKQRLRERYQDCVRHHQQITHTPFEPFPEDVPEITRTGEVDVVYTRNRVLRLDREYYYVLRIDKCSITRERLKDMAVLSSSYGSCLIDFKKQVAAGQCDLAQHAKASNPKQTKSEALRDYFKGSSKLNTDTFPTASGQDKVQNVSCTVYQFANPSVGIARQFCVALPGTDAVNPRQPYPVLATPHQSDIRGVLLRDTNVVESAGTEWRLVADKVELQTTVSPDAFRIPAGMRVLNVRGSNP